MTRLPFAIEDLEREIIGICGDGCAHYDWP